MSDYREQAIADVAKQLWPSDTLPDAREMLIRCCEKDNFYCYAIQQRELYLRENAENANLRGAMKAQDEREERAAERLGMIHSCDWPDEVAESLIAEKAENERLRESLTRLRDCDWTITLPDRMDAVREIARKALVGK